MPKQKRHILLIDGDPVDRLRWRHHLELDSGFGWSIVEEDAITDTMPGELPGLPEERFDCILIVCTPAEAGSSLAGLRKAWRVDRPPIIVIADTDGEIAVTKLIKRGAQECLDRRNISPVELHGAINRVIERAAVQRLFDEQRRRIEEQNRLLEVRQLELGDEIARRKLVESERGHMLLRVRQACEMAETISRAKDEFIALVSHELRAPLNAMLGWARILKSGSVNADTLAHAVEVIERSARAQQKLIEDLLDAARIIKGKLRLETKPVDIVQVVEAATDALRPAAEAKGINLRMAIRESNSIITGDPDRLQQVVWNLLSNAVKFTPADGCVDVKLERADPYIQIDVSDTGKGISRNFLPYIFNRFHQGDLSSTHRQGGLGLGLALSRHIVELHGGTIEAESEGEDRGSTFKVRLPLRALRQQADLDERPVPLENWTGAYSRALEGLRVLVVDDEADARDLVATLLRQCGAYVMTAASAAEALALLGRNEAGTRPDLLVSDIGMPEEDGYSLIRRVRQLAPQEGGLIPAIALTAYGRASDRIQALSAGFQTHMSKPVEPAELVMVISSLTERAVGLGSGVQQAIGFEDRG